MIRKTLQFGATCAALLFGLTPTFGQSIITQDKLHSYVGVLQENAVFAPATGKPHARTNDFVADFTPAGGSIWITNATFLNAATANDILTFAFWAKKYDADDESSAFWADSSQRGFQAHLPWSDNTIYFDTGNGQRISQNILDFPGYSGDESWWNDWHHYVFIQNTFADKQFGSMASSFSKALTALRSPPIWSISGSAVSRATVLCMARWTTSPPMASL